MQHTVTDYKTLVFDCDGVILNSNKVKTDAFYRAALPYSEAAAQALLEYHVAHGGVSRYKKFAYFLEQIVPITAPSVSGPDLDELLSHYAQSVQHGLLTCEVAVGLYELRARTPHANWLIVSGGDQTELRDVFAKRDLDKLFDGGIFGSPETKEIILAHELANRNIQHPALFLGDSKYDYQAANTAGLEFVFLSAWSEVEGWKKFVAEKNLSTRKNIREIANNLKYFIKE
ncbi:HAD family hydrolase [Oceanisphaera sp. IT1-181]|uniref:HAD family hydrolase n=1 Tax=Oceanisphaera sp. IT1-181 TaxID=3081199 RepID=UPI0029CA6D76|nr:HAD family hydrolase [Oceanisphaera sp. IT1-181]